MDKTKNIFKTFLFGEKLRLLLLQLDLPDTSDLELENYT